MEAIIVNNEFKKILAEQDRQWQERQQDKRLHDAYGSQFDILKWDRYVDDESGTILYTNHESGETKEYYLTEIECGTRIIPPDEQKRMQAAKEERIMRDLRRGGKRKEKFVFVDAHIGFEGVSPAMVTRLIYLSTFAGYKSELGKECPKEKQEFGNPIIQNGVHLQKKDLAGVLKLSERNAAYFMKEVCPNYVQEDEDGFLYLDSNSFVRGGLKKRDFKRYQQIYSNGVRRLYEAANGRNLKQLGYVFMMIPFINIEHNILCFNPEETDMDRVIPMSPKEFCGAVGFAYSNLNRLMSVYSSIMFSVNGRKEHFVKLICDYNGQENGKILINPKVIYAGSALNRLEITRLFFAEKTEQPEQAQ